MFELLNPVKTEDYLGYFVTSKSCPECKEQITIAIEGSKLWDYNQGKNIQDVLSNFDEDIRERFMTGICGNCWNKMFRDED